MKCRHLAKGSIYLLFEHLSLVMRLNLSNLCFRRIKKEPEKRTIGHCTTTNSFNFFSLFLSKQKLHHCFNYISKTDIDLKFTDISSTNDQHQISV